MAERKIATPEEIGKFMVFMRRTLLFTHKQISPLSFHTASKLKEEEKTTQHKKENNTSNAKKEEQDKHRSHHPETKSAEHGGPQKISEEKTHKIPDKEKIEELNEKAIQLKRLGDKEHDLNKSCEYHLQAGLIFFELASCLEGQKRLELYSQTAHFFRELTQKYLSDGNKVGLLYLCRAFAYAKCFQMNIPRLKKEREMFIEEHNIRQKQNGGDTAPQINPQKVSSFYKDSGDCISFVECWNKARNHNHSIANSDIDIITISTEQISQLVRKLIEEMKKSSDNGQKRKLATNVDDRNSKKPRKESVQQNNDAENVEEDTNGAVEYHHTNSEFRERGRPSRSSEHKR